jgi:tRNA(fMet)-specific endonuclease VapC
VTIVLLDTNIIVRAVKGREPILTRNILNALNRGVECAVSTITVHEALVGVLRNSNQATAQIKHDTFMKVVKHYWDFSKDDAILSAKIRVDLMDNGMQIGPFDALLAAQALNRNVTFVTNNVSEFSGVPNLSYVDWTKP